MLNKNTLKKILGITLGLMFVLNNMSVPISHAYIRNLNKEIMIDNFIKDTQIYLEEVRDVEESYSAPIDSDGLSRIEDMYKDILDMLDLELNRLTDNTYEKRERLEIESVLQEINIQFSKSMDEIEDKLENDTDLKDDFDKIKDTLLKRTLTFQGRLSTVLKEKISEASTFKSNIIESLSATTEELDVVLNKLDKIGTDLDDLATEVNDNGTTATSSNLDSFSTDAFDFMEEAENETRKLEFLSTTDASKLKSSIREIEDNLEDFIRNMEIKFETNFEDGFEDLRGILENSENQLDKAYGDVIANRNEVDMSAFDVLEKLDSIIERAHDYQESFPTYEIGQIVEKLEDFYNDDEDDDAGDVEDTINELLDTSSAMNATYEQDLEEDTEDMPSQILDGFEAIRKGTYSTTAGAVIASLDEFKDELNTLDIDTLSNLDDFEETEDDIEDILAKSRSKILELRRNTSFGDSISDIDNKISELGTALSDTLEDVDIKLADGYETEFDELEFDTYGTTAESQYSMLQNLHDTLAGVVAHSGDAQTTPNAVLSYINDKTNALSTIESGWGRTMTSETEYRDAEQDIINTLRDIEFEMFRLDGYSFDSNLGSSTTANNIGQYYQTLINEAEDYVDLINSSISSTDNNDLENRIDDLYEIVDDSTSLLEDNMNASILSHLSDILDDIEDEKTRLDRAFNSISVSSSTNSNSQTLANIEDDFTEYEGDILDTMNLVPAELDSYSEMENVSDDTISVLKNIESLVKGLSNKTYEEEDRLSLDSYFDEPIHALFDLVKKLKKNSTTRVRSERRSLERTIKEKVVTFRILMDRIKIEDPETTEFTKSRGLREIERQADKVNYTIKTIDDIDDYQTELKNFRTEFRALEDNLNDMLSLKPALEENDTESITEAKKTYESNFKDTVSRFEDALFGEDDDEYIKDGFRKYTDRYKLILTSLFEGILNGYNAPPVVFEELYEGVDEILEETPTEEALEGVDTEFPDVKKDNPFSPYVQLLTENEAISGYSDGKFHPEKNVSRAEFIKIAAGAKGYVEGELKTSNLTFEDVEKENPLAPFIGYGLKKGYLKGYSDVEFGPNDNITRIDALRVLIRMLNLTSNTIPTKSAYFSDITTSDLATLTDRAYDAKLISGFKDGTFKPIQAITRGEASKIIANAFLQKENQ